MTPLEIKLTTELAAAAIRISDLELAMGLGNENLAVKLRLPAMMNNLLGCLLATPNVTSEMITLRLNIATDAKVAVHRLRGILKTHNLLREDGTSMIQGRRTLGYWIDAGDKNKINAVTLEGNNQSVAAIRAAA